MWCFLCGLGRARCSALGNHYTDPLLALYVLPARDYQRSVDKYLSLQLGIVENGNPRRGVNLSNAVLNDEDRLVYYFSYLHHHLSDARGQYEYLR